MLMLSMRLCSSEGQREEQAVAGVATSQDARASRLEAG